MCARRRHTQRGRPRQPAPQTLPDDLYDYDDDPAPRISSPRGSPPDAFDVEKLPVIDDWPEKVPITEAEIQVFERGESFEVIQPGIADGGAFEVQLGEVFHRGDCG